MWSARNFYTSIVGTRTTARQRPYRDEYTGSLPNSEVNRRRARSVLPWGTGWEALWVLLALLGSNSHYLCGWFVQILVLLLILYVIDIGYIVANLALGSLFPSAPPEDVLAEGAIA